MVNVKVTVRRKDRLFAKLRRLAPETQRELVQANRKSAYEMASTAKGFAPVKTGKLRDSIEVTPPGAVPPSYSQGAAQVPPGAFMVTAGNSQVRYPHLVEYGTHAHAQAGMFEGTTHPGNPPQPFFWPAYRLLRKRMRSRASRAITKAVKKVAGK